MPDTWVLKVLPDALTCILSMPLLNNSWAIPQQAGAWRVTAHTSESLRIGLLNDVIEDLCVGR